MTTPLVGIEADLADRCQELVVQASEDSSWRRWRGSEKKQTEIRRIGVVGGVRHIWLY
jgi:hypothetical protein